MPANNKICFRECFISIVNRDTRTHTQISESYMILPTIDGSGSGFSCFSGPFFDNSKKAPNMGIGSIGL